MSVASYPQWMLDPRREVGEPNVENGGSNHIVWGELEHIRGPASSSHICAEGWSSSSTGSSGSVMAERSAAERLQALNIRPGEVAFLHVSSSSDSGNKDSSGSQSRDIPGPIFHRRTTTDQRPGHLEATYDQLQHQQLLQELGWSHSMEPYPDSIHRHGEPSKLLDNATLITPDVILGDPRSESKEEEGSLERWADCNDDADGSEFQEQLQEASDVEVVPEAPLDDTRQRVPTSWITHYNGQCKPCYFLTSVAGCTRGRSCTFCHFEHEKPKKDKKCKGQRERYRKLVQNLTQQIVDDPEAFDFDALIVRLPPSVRNDAHAMNKLLSQLRQIQLSAIADGKDDKGEVRFSSSSEQIGSRVSL